MTVSQDAPRALTPLALVVLSVFFEGPTHPYDLLQTLLSRHEDRIVKLKPGTLYHTVARLEKDGLIAQSSVDRDGNRPERTTYALTEAGAQIVHEQVREMLRAPVHEYPELPVALSEAHTLEADEATALLEERIEHLNGIRERLRETCEEGQSNGTPKLFMLDTSYLHDHTDFEIRWLEKLVSDIRSGRLDWNAIERSEYLSRLASAKKGK